LPILFITGASGNFGKVLLPAATHSSLYDHWEVRSGTSSDKKVAELKQSYPKINWVVCDLNKDEQIDAAFHGVHTLFLIPGGVENRGELGVKAVQHAKKNGVKHIITFSVIGAEYKSILFGRQFRMVEEEAESSGIAWTHLRTLWFQENLFGWLAPIKQGILPIALGDGKVPWMNLADAAQASLAILNSTDNRSHHNKAYAITGPELLTTADVAAIISKSLGREIKPICPSDEEQLAALLGAGWPEWQAKGCIELLVLLRNNGAAFVSPDFKNLTGKEGTKLSDWFETVKGAFA